MAVEHSEALELALALKEQCESLETCYWRICELLARNSAMSIDWGAQSKPASLNEDADGNLDGAKFTRIELANCIGSLDNFRKLLAGENVSGATGNHLGNVLKITSAN